MKTKIVILFLVSILLSSCVQTTPTQEDEVVETATEKIVTEEPVSQPITTEEPIATEAPTKVPTPTLDLLSFEGSWERFSDHIYGISIEYPLIYGEELYKDVCAPFETRDGIHFGENSQIFIRQKMGKSLENHILSFLVNLHPDGYFMLESQESLQINDQPASRIKYKLDETGEIREFIFVAATERDVIYTFSFEGGTACDVPEIGVSEQTVFEHALESFYLEK
jgi:hypothetical protein